MKVFAVVKVEVPILERLRAAAEQVDGSLKVTGSDVWRIEDEVRAEVAEKTGGHITSCEIRGEYP